MKIRICKEEWWPPFIQGEWPVNEDKEVNIEEHEYKELVGLMISAFTECSTDYQKKLVELYQR